MNIWVVGNGQSRQGFAHSCFNGYIIGCNAVYRDISCNELVSVDMRMVNEILRSEQDTPVYTRQDWYPHYTDQRVRPLPDLPFSGESKRDQPFHWNSGPYAILLAANKNPKTINLLGFDLWSTTGFVNNIYKNTQNYAKENSSPVDPSFWIYQLEKIFKHFRHIEFVQHQQDNWRIPDSWKGIENLTFKYFCV